VSWFSEGSLDRIRSWSLELLRFSPIPPQAINQSENDIFETKPAGSEKNSQLTSHARCIDFMAHRDSRQTTWGPRTANRTFSGLGELRTSNLDKP